MSAQVDKESQGFHCGVYTAFIYCSFTQWHCIPALFRLQDYLVLLPSAYYEAPILQIRVTEPCTYSSVADGSQKYICTHIFHLNQVISYWRKTLIDSWWSLSLVKDFFQVLNFILEGIKMIDTIPTSV